MPSAIDPSIPVHGTAFDSIRTALSTAKTEISALISGSGIAAFLQTATTLVSIGTATAPNPGDVLTATAADAAEWQAPQNNGYFPQGW